MPNQIIGQQAEDYACAYLQQQGLKLITRNFRCLSGELDLVMREQDTLVFIEVRYRKNFAFGGPFASITPSKQRKLRQSIAYYLQRHPSTLSIRCDVIGISVAANQDWALDWIKNAINAQT